MMPFGALALGDRVLTFDERRYLAGARARACHGDVSIASFLRARTTEDRRIVYIWRVKSAAGIVTPSPSLMRAVVHPVRTG